MPIVVAAITAAPLIARPALCADLSTLVTLENRCFDVDAQSRRSLRYLLMRAHAANRVVEVDGALAGHVCVLFRRASRLARVYSLAVDPMARGRGLGRVLLAAAEADARGAGCVRIASEVRRSNRASRALFAAVGYAPVRRLPDYYPRRGGGREDGIRLEKTLSYETNSMTGSDG